MTVDLLTLSIALNLANVLQCMALVGLAVANRERVGLRWWAAGMGSLALGLILTTMRDVISLPLWLHAISNAMVGNGMLILYYGIRRFFGDNDDPRRFIVIGLLIFIANIVLAFTGDVPPLRRILFSVVVSVLSILIAVRLHHELHTDYRLTVLFLLIVFVANTICHSWYRYNDRSELVDRISTVADGNLSHGYCYNDPVDIRPYFIGQSGIDRQTA